MEQYGQPKNKAIADPMVYLRIDPEMLQPALENVFIGIIKGIQISLGVERVK